MTRRSPTTKPVAYPLGPQFRKEITRCRAFGFFFANSNSRDIVFRSCSLTSSEEFFAKPRDAGKHRTSAIVAKLQSCLVIRASLSAKPKGPKRKPSVHFARRHWSGFVKELKRESGRISTRGTARGPGKLVADSDALAIRSRAGMLLGLGC